MHRVRVRLVQARGVHHVSSFEGRGADIEAILRAYLSSGVERSNGGARMPSSLHATLLPFLNAGWSTLCTARAAGRIMEFRTVYRYDHVAPTGLASAGTIGQSLSGTHL